MRFTTIDSEHWCAQMRDVCAYSSTYSIENDQWLLAIPARVGPSPRDRELSIDRRRRVARVSRATARVKRIAAGACSDPPLAFQFCPRNPPYYTDDDAVPAVYSLARDRPADDAAATRTTRPLRTHAHPTGNYAPRGPIDLPIWLYRTCLDVVEPAFN